jgi:hypothetical protein
VIAYRSRDYHNGTGSRVFLTENPVCYTCALMELIMQGHGPVRQPAVRGPQSVGKCVEGIVPLPKLAELGAHLVERGVLVTGAELELLSPTSRNL